MENYFDSVEFVSALSPLKEQFYKGNLDTNGDIIQYFVGIAIRYAQLISTTTTFTTEGLSKFLNQIATHLAYTGFSSGIRLTYDITWNQYVAKMLIDALLEQFKLTRKDMEYPEITSKLRRHILKNLKSKQYKYHAFNAACFSSIQQFGICPNVQLTSQDEIDNIYHIFEEHDLDDALGWRKVNCEGFVSYSETPAVSYYYGMSSPEWFCQMTGEATPYARQDVAYDRTAFKEGNYDKAKENLTTLMRLHAFTTSEEQVVLEFFDKNWNLYANQDILVAVIPEEGEIEELTDFWENMYQELRGQDTLEKVLLSCISDYNVDCQTKETIEVTHAIFLKLPRYNHFMKRFEEVDHMNLESEKSATFK